MPNPRAAIPPSIYPYTISIPFSYLSPKGHLSLGSSLTLQLSSSVRSRPRSIWERSQNKHICDGVHTFREDGGSRRVYPANMEVYPVSTNIDLAVVSNQETACTRSSIALDDTPFPIGNPAILATMATSIVKEAFDSELVHWLTCGSRCFGDKGDVEDITEGQHRSGTFLMSVLCSDLSQQLI